MDSAKQNLASTIVNGFLNAGFGKDSLMTGVSICLSVLSVFLSVCVCVPVSVFFVSVSVPVSVCLCLCVGCWGGCTCFMVLRIAIASSCAVGDDKWLYRNKDHGQTAASASVGMIHMWDVFTGFAELDRYRESEIQSIKAGSLIGMGACGGRISRFLSTYSCG